MNPTPELVNAVADLQGMYMRLVYLLGGVAAASTAFTVLRAYLRLKDF
jgi:hypothetical protein